MAYYVTHLEDERRVIPLSEMPVGQIGLLDNNTVIRMQGPSQDVWLADLTDDVIFKVSKSQSDDRVTLFPVGQKIELEVFD